MRIAKKFFPFLNWRISRETLSADTVAGITVALVLIPQSMAYANLAGLAPHIGLYAAFLPAIVGALWGSSRHLQTGPSAMMSLLTATTIASLGVMSAEKTIQMAGMLALLTGIVWLAFSLLRFTFVVNFFSRPVIEGFVHAGAVIIAISQIGKMLAIEMPRSGHFFHNVWTHLILQLSQTHVPTCIVGGGSFVLLLTIKKFFPRLPAALIVMVLSTGAVYIFTHHNGEAPVEIVGAIPAGLPSFVAPRISIATLVDLMPGALVIAFVGFMETCSVAKAIAAQNRQRISIRQETLGQGLASLSSALSGGYPVSASFSRSALDYAAGSKTSASAVVTGVVVMLFLLFFTDLIYFLPIAALAAIIMSAVINLMHFRKFVTYFNTSVTDGITAVLTFWATLVFAPHLERGILFGVIVSLVFYLYRTMQPNISILGRLSNGTYRDADRHYAHVDPAMPIIRLDCRLYFANSSYFEESVLALLEKYPDAHHIVIDCKGINEIDASGVETLQQLVVRLRESGVQLLFSGVKYPVQHIFDKSGLTKSIGRENFVEKLDDAYQKIV